jgi:hypothetical protein
MTSKLHHSCLKARLMRQHEKKRIGFIDSVGCSNKRDNNEFNKLFYDNWMNTSLCFIIMSTSSNNNYFDCEIILPFQIKDILIIKLFEWYIELLYNFIQVNVKNKDNVNKIMLIILNYRLISDTVNILVCAGNDNTPLEYLRLLYHPIYSSNI